MTTLFTEIDLIRYIYGESSENEKSEIENAAIFNAELGEQLDNMQSEKGMLDILSFSPSEIALKSIFNFSLGYAEDS